MNNTAEEELFKTTLTKNGQSFSYVPMTERVRALREWPQYAGYGIITHYEILPHDMLVGDQFVKNARCIVQAVITDSEGRQVSTGTDSCPYFFTTFKEPTKIQEDTDFCAKAESGAISRALQNLGIALPTKEELQMKESGKNGAGNYKQRSSATGNTTAPGSFQQTPPPGATSQDESKLIEQYTRRSVADLRRNGGEVVTFEGKGDFQLKFNPDKRSYYWSNVDKSVTENKYISTTVTPAQ